MRQDYQKMQEQILPNREKQDEMWEIIEQKAAKGRSKSGGLHTARLAGGVAAAMLACLLCLPQAGFAANIKSFLDKYFETPADIEQDIVEQVYEDSDGHVKMQVTRMLSDGACVYLDICYEALDDIGKHWLSDAEMGVDAMQFLYEGEAVGKTVGYTFGLEEYRDMATEQARYFTFHYEDFSGNFYMNGIERILSYPMCQKEGKGSIKIISNMDTFAYRLEGEGSPSRFYEPKYLLISKLSYGIFGKNQGVYTQIKSKSGSKTFMNEEFLSSPDSDGLVQVTFLLKDGSKIKPDSMAGFSPALNVPGCDLTIEAGYFNCSIYWERHITIDPEELAGVEIEGSSYELVPE